MSRKGENIYKRKDGRWEGRYIKSRFPDGKAIYGYVYAGTYREAKTKLLLALSNLSSTKPDASHSTKNKRIEKFGDVAISWLEHVQPQLKESTSNKYRNLLESYILPEIKEVPLCSIDRDLIESLCNRLLLTGGKQKAGLSAKTVADVLSVIRAVLRFANEKGNPVSCNLQSIKIKQNMTEMRVLSRGEQEQLCRYLITDLNAGNVGILVCLFTGMRIGEICALQWDDISLDEKTIHVHQTMQRIQTKMDTTQKTKIVVTTPKSACSIRTIPIPDGLIEFIFKHKTTATGYFLTNSSQKYMEPRNLQNHFKQVLKTCAVDPANYHSLRHTFATRCVELGFDVKSLSEILGHASVNITMNRYVHPSMELKKENMRKLTNLITVK